MASDLKPCPFCGATSGIRNWGYNTRDGERVYEVRCRTCWVRGPQIADKRLAADGWNRRVNDGK